MKRRFRALILHPGRKTPLCPRKNPAGKKRRELMDSMTKGASAFADAPSSCRKSSPTAIFSARYCRNVSAQARKLPARPALPVDPNKSQRGCGPSDNSPRVYRQFERSICFRRCSLSLLNAFKRHTLNIVQFYKPEFSCERLAPVTYRMLPAYSIMLATTPEPTVRPPSRIAKRRPCSMAMGVIRVISMSMLSPGITISTPSGSLMLPVTSVVRK